MLTNLMAGAAAAESAPFSTKLVLTSKGVEIHVEHADLAYLHLVGWRELDRSRANELVRAITHVNRGMQAEIDLVVAASCGSMQERRPTVRRLP